MGTKNRLAGLREAQGWSREELALRLQARGHYGRGPRHPALSNRTIYRWEIGESSIPDKVKATLADLFGVSLDHLMGRDSRNGNNHEAAA